MHSALVLSLLNPVLLVKDAILKLVIEIKIKASKTVGFKSGTALKQVAMKARPKK